MSVWHIDQNKLIEHQQQMLEQNHKRITELEDDNARLMNDVSTNDIEFTKLTLESIAQHQHIEALESLIEDSMKVMKLYINVPEFDDLRDRWEKLKEQ